MLSSYRVQVAQIVVSSVNDYLFVHCVSIPHPPTMSHNNIVVVRFEGKQPQFDGIARFLQGGPCHKGPVSIVLTCNYTNGFCSFDVQVFDLQFPYEEHWGTLEIDIDYKNYGGIKSASLLFRNTSMGPATKFEATKFEEGAQLSKRFASHIALFKQRCLEHQRMHAPWRCKHCGMYANSANHAYRLQETLPCTNNTTAGHFQLDGKPYFVDQGKHHWVVNSREEE